MMGLFLYVLSLVPAVTCPYATALPLGDWQAGCVDVHVDANMCVLTAQCALGNGTKVYNSISLWGQLTDYLQLSEGQLSGGECAETLKP